MNEQRTLDTIQPHRAAAEKFLEAFPVGSSLSPTDFDTWARTHGLLNTPPDIPKRSDTWLAHLQRRHQLRYSISRQGLRLGHDGKTSAFTIEAINGKTWMVRTPHEAIIHSQVGRKIDRVTNTKRKHLELLMASADWKAVTPWDRMVAEQLVKAIKRLSSRVTFEVDAIDADIKELQERVQRSLEMGEIKTANGTLKALLAKPDDEEPEPPGETPEETPEEFSGELPLS